MSFVGSVAAHADTSVSSYTLNPTGTGYVAGDLLILQVGINNTGAQTATPSGSWNTFATMTQSSGTVTVYYKTAVASEPIITITHSSSSRGASLLEIRRGESMTGTLTFTPDANNTSTPVAPAGTLAAGNVLHEVAWMRSSNWTASDVWAAAPAGMTKRGESISVGNGGIALSSFERSTAGAYSATTYTTSPTSVQTQTGGVGVFATSTAVHSGTLTESSGGRFTGWTVKKGAQAALGVAMRSGNSAATAVTGTRGSSAGGGHVVGSTGFEGGAAGATVPTNGTDLYNGGNNVGTGTAVYATNWSHSGGQSMRIRTPATTDQANRSVSFTAQGIFLFRGYLHMTSLPSNAAWIMVSLTSSTLAAPSIVAQLRMSTAGVVTMRDGSIAVGSTVALAAGQDYRIEWKVDPDPSTGSQTLRVWNQGNVDGAIAAFDTQITTTATGTAATTADSFSDSAFGAAVVDANWDDVAFGDVDWIGPTTVVGQDATGTISLSGGGDLSVAGTRVRQVNVVLSGGTSTAAVAATKTQPDNANPNFATGVDVTVRKDAQATFALSGGGAFSTSAFATVTERHSGLFLDSSGGAFTVTVRRATTTALPAVSGGLSAAAAATFTHRAGHKQTAVLSGGGALTVAGFQTTAGTTSISLSGGGALTVTGRKGVRTATVLSGGVGALVWPTVKKATGSVLLRTGSTVPEPTWTFDHQAGVAGNIDGTFALQGGGSYHISTGVVGWVILEWNVTVDDHPRPTWHPLWRRVRYPGSKYALLLFRDGRVIETPTLLRTEEWDADFVISGGWYGPEDDWVAQVLRDAGYTLVNIDQSSGLPGVPA